jgi:hypothetical protein
MYIRGIRILPSIFETNDPVHVNSYIDASYGVHMDAKSDTISRTCHTSYVGMTGRYCI